jgi:hypothetical protein
MDFSQSAIMPAPSPSNALKAFARDLSSGLRRTNACIFAKFSTNRIAARPSDGFWAELTSHLNVRATFQSTGQRNWQFR